MRPSSGLVIALALASRAALGAPVNDVCSQATEVPEQFRNRDVATRKQKLPLPAAGTLLEAAGQVASALSDGA